MFPTPELHGAVTRGHPQSGCVTTTEGRDERRLWLGAVQSARTPPSRTGNASPTESIGGKYTPVEHLRHWGFTVPIPSHGGSGLVQYIAQLTGIAFNGYARRELARVNQRLGLGPCIPVGTAVLWWTPRFFPEPRNRHCRATSRSAPWTAKGNSLEGVTPSSAQLTPRRQCKCLFIQAPGDVEKNITPLI